MEGKSWFLKRLLQLSANRDHIESNFIVLDILFHTKSAICILQFTLKVIGHMIMSLEPTGEEQEKFRSNFKIISSSFASLPFKLPGTAFHRGIKVTKYYVTSHRPLKITEHSFPLMQCYACAGSR